MIPSEHFQGSVPESLWQKLDMWPNYMLPGEYHALITIYFIDSVQSGWHV